MHVPKIHLEWGLEGLDAALARQDVVAIVDVLSFCTTVCAALAQGASIAPVPWGEDAEAWAERFEPKALTRNEGGRRALSPLGFDASSAGKLYAISSPNGAHFSHRGKAAPALFAACLRNASASAQALQECAADLTCDISVIACGERWPVEGMAAHVGPLRVALEDGLGAAAVIAGLAGELSADARIAARIFEQSYQELDELLCACPSGVELIERDLRDEVSFAAEYDVEHFAARLVGERYTL